MKSLSSVVVITISILSGNPVFADSNAQGVAMQEAMYKMAVDMWQTSRNRNCRKYSELGSSLLDFRTQGRGSLADYMEWATSNLEAGETTHMKAFRVRIVRNAYDAPLYQTGERLNRAKARLRDEIFAYCFDAWSEISGIAEPDRERFGLSGS